MKKIERMRKMNLCKKFKAQRKLDDEIMKIIKDEKRLRDEILKKD